MSIQKNDFIELEFAGKIKDTGEVFDTNIKSEIDRIKANFQPKKYILAVGHNMTIKGLDKDLEGKEVGKTYESDFKAEDAFGKRNPAMVKMIPLKVFIEQRIQPQKGMQLSLDGTIVKVISVSGGRVLVDFNNPLAGKILSYKYTIIRKLEDQKEKIDALQEFFFRNKFEYEIKDKELIFKVGKDIGKFVEIMSKPFEEILGLTVKIEEVEKKSEDKKQI
jgi:FKBP-type peptidyl-prolyl cis-trans isomerase 2